MSAATQEPKPLAEYRPMERDIDIEKIAEQVEERRLAEIAARDGAANSDANEGAQPAEPVAPAPEPVAAPVDQVAKQMRKVKVDGTEIEVSDDDLVASYRQQETTRREMHAAQQARAEADRLLAEARAKAATPVEPAPDRAEKVKEYHDALLTGDMETANRLFDEVMLTGRQESPPDVNTIIQQATPVIKQQLSNESALDRFTTDYQDVIADANLTLIAQAELRKLEAEGKPYAEALFAAGNHARDWLKAKMPLVETGQPTTRAEKLGKKAEITQIPTANSKATSTAERELTTSEIIAAERARRGLD